MNEQAPYSRGQTNTRHSNLLTGKIFDEDGAPYTPVFTKKKGKQYRYYLNKNLDDYKDHPKGLIARLPAHEIEATVEAVIRTHLSSKEKLLKILPFDAEEDEQNLQHIITHQSSIRTDKLFTKSISKVIVKQGTLVIKICAAALRDVISTDLELDIPQNELENLVKGLVWREEHFGGAPLQMIADKYGHSKSHININILKTLKAA